MDWIEINEDRSNLPEICSEVLVTYKHGEITTELSLFGEDGVFYDINGNNNWDNRVIAWMYMPKPFKK